MVPSSMIRKRIDIGAIMLVLFGLIAGLGAEEITLLRPNLPPAETRTLSFPPGQCTGNLYLEPESGPGWDPEHVTLSVAWEYLSAAQGDVPVPEGRNVQLLVYLALGPRESARLHAQNPWKHQLTVADRVRKDPENLSGLAKLDPNDLFRLSVCSAMYRRTGTDPRIFEPIRHLTGLRILSLNETGVTDKGLEHLRALRSLRALEFRESSITSRGLEVLKDLPALEYLDLRMEVTDAGLKHIGQHPNLRWLRIRTGKIWGPGLAELANMSRLERLCIWGTSPISDRHIKYLEGLAQLKSLTLWGSACNTLTDASLASIGELKNLEELHFIRTSPRFTVAGVARLNRLKNLKKVDFAQVWSGPRGVHYGDEVVRQLAALPNLECIKGISYLSAEGMKTLMVFRNLKCLGIALKDREQGYYGPTGVSYLAGLGSLEELRITGDDSLSDADLACLEPLSRLRDLLISGQNVTDRGLASIGKLKQLESLHLGCPVTPSGLNQLNRLSNLQYLTVKARGNTGVTDPGDELMLDLSGLKKMKDMNLSGLPLQDSDLAFLKCLPLLENLMIQPDSLTGAALRHLRALPELNRLFVSGLSSCTGEDIAHLNSLPKLRSLTLIGDITNSTLASLTGPLSLESVSVDTDEPIRKETVTNLTRSHPVIEYIHINELQKVPTRPPQEREPTRVSQPRTNRRAPSRRR